MGPPREGAQAHDGDIVRHHVLEDRSRDGRTEAEIVAGMLGAQISEAVHAGIKQAASDPQVWAHAVTALQAHAAREAGGWLFGGIKAALSRLAWVLIIGLGLYMLGGWGALVAFFKTGGHPS